MVPLQQQVAGTWTAMDTSTVGGGGRYAFSTPVSSGSWRVRLPGNADHGGGVSPTLVVP